MKILLKLWRRLNYQPDPPLSAFQMIWSQSKVNGAQYDGDKLPAHRWAWPRVAK